MQREMIHLAEDVPVIDEVDICVVGGSCTGVFAAVRAARLGGRAVRGAREARVAIVERQNHFGGVAAIVCTWHSLRDTEYRRQIIAGLTQEVLDRLDQRGAVRMIANSPHKGAEFRPGDLKLVLDELITEHRVRPHLNTLCTGAVVRDGKLIGITVENKSGRGVIKAKAFVDASGDGDLCARLGLEQYRYPEILPPTVCAFVAGWPEQYVDIGSTITEHADEFGLPPGFVWGSVLPGTNLYMMAGTRVPHVDCSDAAELTRAEMEGRRQVKGIMDLLRKYRPELKIALHDFPGSIGIRDTRHFRCLHQLSGDELLRGTRYEDAIANGSYRVDTHHQDRPGITFLYLDGTRVHSRPGFPDARDRWREETAENPTFYQIPLRSLIPGRYDNLILAGRMLDADLVAFSAVRVMVNMNQTGEAAGVAAYLALESGKAVAAVDAPAVRAELARGGSVVL